MKMNEKRVEELQFCLKSVKCLLIVCYCVVSELVRNICVHLAAQFDSHWPSSCAPISVLSLCSRSLSLTCSIDCAAAVAEREVKC